jgi:hypothetical protein
MLCTYQSEGLRVELAGLSEASGAARVLDAFSVPSLCLIQKAT